MDTSESHSWRWGSGRIGTPSPIGWVEAKRKSDFCDSVSFGASVVYNPVTKQHESIGAAVGASQSPSSEVNKLYFGSVA